MPISVDEIIEDDDLAQNYIIYESQGSWVNGRWIEGEAVQIPARGTITVSNEKDLLLTAEGDRIKGAMDFYNKGPIYTTRVEPGQALSDKIYWRDDWYKIISVAPYGDYGLYKATGVRITGA